jgi:hypothetical protein
MNDLARIALRTGRAVRVGVAAHPAPSLAVAGFAAASLTEVAGGQVGTVKSVIPLTRWFGLLSSNGHRSGDYLPGAMMLLGIVLLVVLWLVAIRLHHVGTATEGRVWWIAGAWSAPFVIGPPLLSNDVFTYAAQGLLLRNGLDPYSVGPSALGNVHAVAAVDPSWRSVPSPYGPLATTIQHLAVAASGGSPLGATIIFRALGVVSLVAIGLLAAELAGPRRVQALTMTVLNPLLLLHIVSGAHLDGVMCALLLGAVLAANQRRWLLGLVLAAAAGSVKVPGFTAVLAIMAVHLQGYRGRVAWRIGTRDAAVAAASILGFSLLVKNGWGWIHALNTPALGHTALAPASLVSDLYSPIVDSASFDDLAAGGRIAALLAAACIVIYLTMTARNRALDRTVGYGMLAVGLLGPVVYPWYLLGGIVILAPTARAVRRDWLIALSAAGCVLSPPGFTTRISTNISIVAVAVALVVIAPRVLHRRRPDPHAAVVGPTVSAPAVGPAVSGPAVSAGGSPAEPREPARS